MEDVITENIVVEAKIADQFDLDKLSSELIDSRYNPDDFPGVMLSLPGASVILTKDGKFICTGTKTIDEAKQILSRIVNMLKEKGFEAKEKVELDIKNLIISLETKKGINIKRLAIGSDNVDYDPEAFPGAVYRGEGGLLALVFDNGKVVCTGSNDRDRLEKFLDEVVKRAMEVG